MSTLVRARKLLLRGLVLPALALVLLTAVGWGLVSRGFPDLRPWHTEAPHREWTASDTTPSSTLEEYLAREDEVMREVAERVEGAFTPTALDAQVRYAKGSRTNPTGFRTNWNRTFQRQPAHARGGALLLHGMTDSPYSMRAMADRLEAEGYYVLALRMPGHGTTPAGLARARWQDWAAAARLGARHVRHVVGDGAPLLVVGYSNGGALAVDYALDAITDASLPRPDRLVLVSPMIGVTPFAGLSRLISLLDGVPYFERAAWTSVQPEYNPFKYNSFPTSAGQESHRLTAAVAAKLKTAVERGAIAKMPPVLTFQSIVDSTVVTGAVVSVLYDRLPDNGSALVMFDLNRRAGARAFMPPSVDALFDRLVGTTARRYRLSVVTNVSTEAAGVGEFDTPAGATSPNMRDLGLSWPAGIYSLSHVALPFPMDDPLYGLEPREDEDYGIRIGRVQVRGERGVLLVSADDLLRLSCNPFYAYLDERLRAWVAPAGETGSAPSAAPAVPVTP